jgi:hypothetical protein
MNDFQCRVGGKPLKDEVAEANLGGERESLFLGGSLIFVWSAPHGFVVVGIHDNYNPPTIVLITSDADLDGVLLHVRFVQVDCGSRRRNRLSTVRRCHDSRRA